jgi:hypothetical protein
MSKNAWKVNEKWREESFGSNRCECGGFPLIRIQTFMEVAELERRSPIIMAAFRLDCAERGDGLPTIMLRSSPTADPKPHLKTSVVYACSRCRKYLELAAAHAPSHAIVEITTGPVDRLIVPVIAIGG